MYSTFGVGRKKGNFKEFHPRLKREVITSWEQNQLVYICKYAAALWAEPARITLIECSGTGCWNSELCVLEMIPILSQPCICCL